jgi:hypothetical protein
MEVPMPQIDFEVIDNGSAVQFFPATEAGAEWLEDNIEPDEHLRPGGTLVVGHRIALDLIDGLRTDGLRCHVGWLH